MKKIALISAILENPSESQQKFNSIVSEHKELVRGRMGLPFDDYNIAVISITVMGTMDEINKLTGKLGKLPSVTVKTAVSQKQICEPV